MSKLFQFRTNSVIVSWLTSYMLILLVPVAIMIMSYFGIKDQIKDEINKSNTGKAFNLSFNEWESLINNSYEGEYILISNNSTANIQGSILYIYIRSLPVINKGETKANVIIRLNKNKFRDYTKGIESVNGGIIIIQDENDKLMAASNALIKSFDQI